MAKSKLSKSKRKDEIKRKQAENGVDEQMRGAGILLHITSLPSQYGCGSFGKEAKRFIDIISDIGFRYWQVLPLNIPDEDASPYSSASSFFGNPLMIDLETLYQDGIITSGELKKQVTTPVCSHSKRNSQWHDLRSRRMAFLREIWELTETPSPTNKKLRKNVADYLQDSVYVKQACEFFAYKKTNDNKPWQEWTITEENIDTLEDKRDAFDADVMFYAFLSYEFEKQWKNIKQYANSKHIKVIGDVPIYVNLQSSDVYYNKKFFMLKKDGHPEYVSGVIADEYQNGQLWGHPLYNLNEMELDNYSFLVSRYKYYLKQFDIIRIDHFKAFDSYDAIPADKPIVNKKVVGKKQKGIGRKCLEYLMNSAGIGGLIAEDVGAEDNMRVQRLLSDFNIPGMTILQNGGIIGSRDNSVLYTGTHDNNTLMGYLCGKDDSQCEKIAEDNAVRALYISDFKSQGAKHSIDRKALAKTLIEKMLGSKARIVIIPMQDILLQDENARMNVPGRDIETNWMYSLSNDDMNKFAEQMLEWKQLLIKYTHNKITWLDYGLTDIFDYYGEVIVTYHRKDENDCKILFDKLDKYGYRYYKNAIDETVIRNPEYEDKFDKRLASCRHMILIFSQHLINSRVVMRHIWYQVGSMHANSNCDIVAYRLGDVNLKAIKEGSNGCRNISETPIGEGNIQDINNFEITNGLSNKWCDVLCERYYNEGSEIGREVNGYVVKKISYRHLEIRLELDGRSIKNATDAKELLEDISVDCYLLRFSIDGHTLMNDSMKDEIDVRYHIGFLPNGCCVDKRVDAKDGKYYFKFDVLVPVHDLLGSVVKMFFTYGSSNERSFSNFKKSIFDTLSMYELAQKDVVVGTKEYEKHNIYFSLDFSRRDIGKDLNVDEQGKYRIGRAVDQFYPK